MKTELRKNCRWNDTVDRGKELSRIFFAIAFFSGSVGLLLASSASANAFESPEILVLGDSQLSFGAGPVMLDFFHNVKSHCGDFATDSSVFDDIEKMRTTLIGARSTSLLSWITTKGPPWRKLCRKDTKWKVNASIWGSLKPQGDVYVQLGEGANFQFCKRGKTPLQSMFADGYYTPRLVIFNLLGNGAYRWASSPKLAHDDVRRLVKQLPMEVPCIFMTTMPGHTKSRNDRRIKAQGNLEIAFADHHNRCTMVRGLTPETISAIQGQNHYFRRKKSGAVKDPFHPDKNATKKFLSLVGESLCTALLKELQMEGVGANAKTTTPGDVQAE